MRPRRSKGKASRAQRRVSICIAINIASDPIVANSAAADTLPRSWETSVIASPAAIGTRRNTTAPIACVPGIPDKINPPTPNKIPVSPPTRTPISEPLPVVHQFSRVLAAVEKSVWTAICLRHSTLSSGLLRSSPVGAVEGSVLDGLAQMLGLDAGRTFQVCNGARHFQDAVVGTRGQAQALNSGLQQLFALA